MNYARSSGFAAPAATRKRDSLAGMIESARGLHHQGLLKEAAAAYKQILKKYANQFDALNLLGVCEFQAGNAEGAARLLRRAVAVDPSSAQANSNLGAVLTSLDLFSDALAHCDQAIVSQKSFSDAHFNRGNALMGLKRYAEAVVSFDDALALSPQNANLLNNKGNALHELGRHEDAIGCYDEALRLQPGFALAYVNRGATLQEMKRSDDAIVDFDRALALDPTNVGALTNRGEALLSRRRMTDALASFDKAIGYDSRSPEAWLGRGNILMMSKQVAEAMRACETALEIAPSHVKGLIQLGQCHAMQSNAKAAISCFDRALAFKPNSEAALSNRIFAMDLSEDADFAQQQAVKSAWWHQIGRNISEKYKTPHQNRRDLTKQIVLGYVSADYNSHSAAFAIHPIMRNHDKSRFDIICYSTSPKVDHVTETFRACANRWRDASQWSDDVLAECIRADGVDILIDLSGHTEGNRLGVFARKPAPVQVTAWGHATGTGLPTIDYLFADPVSIPAHVRHIYAEQIRDLPCVITIEELPAHLREAVPPKLVRGYTTYGVFNRVSKFSDAAIAAWARILIADGESRMLIKDGLIDDVRIRSNLVQRFATHGIAAERIDLQGATSREDHLAAYAKVDICLDPFPYGGGVSTWEALYMGVPVVAKLGNTVASRMTGAILSAVGLAGWVVSNEDEYVERALQSDAARLQGLRSELPGMIALRCGPAAYTKAVEDAYQAMWSEYCGS